MEGSKLLESETLAWIFRRFVYSLEHLQCQTHAGSVQKPQGKDDSKWLPGVCSDKFLKKSLRMQQSREINLKMHACPYLDIALPKRFLGALFSLDLKLLLALLI